MIAEVGMTCLVDDGKALKAATVIKITKVASSKTQILDVKLDDSGVRNYFKLNKEGVWVNTECNHTGRWNLKNSLILTF